MSAPPVLAVVVLYRLEPARSKTLTGLARALDEDPALRREFDVLVWDNTPAAAAAPALPLPARYHRAGRNLGVAGAYNAAAALAGAEGRDWLLLLDQDTSVTAACLRALLGALPQAQADPHVAAVVPFLYAGDFQLSPRQWRFGRHVPLPRPAAGRAERRAIFAANSGTLLRLAALREAGGYNPRFWLDHSDIELFERLHRAGRTAWLVPEARIEHEVAMLDYDRRMTQTRYASYLAAESDFLDLYRGPLERALHLARLAARVLRQRRLRDREYSRMTARELWRRLATGRAARLRGREPLSPGAHDPESPSSESPDPESLSSGSSSSESRDTELPGPGLSSLGPLSPGRPDAGPPPPPGR